MKTWSPTRRTAAVILLVFAGYFGGLAIWMTLDWRWGFGLAIASLLAPLVLAATRLPGSGGPARDRFVFLALTLLFAAGTAYAFAIDIPELIGMGAVVTPLAFVAWYSRR